MPDFLNSLKNNSNQLIILLYALVWIYNYYAPMGILKHSQACVLGYLSVIYMSLRINSAGDSDPNVQNEADRISQKIQKGETPTNQEELYLRNFYQYSEDGYFRIKYEFCKTCQHIKLPRTHHCSKCRRCVAMMDHHCYFINKCVGGGNYNIFLQFLFTCLLVIA
jgi:hypothetical protein